jgi:hypothetical protein
MAVRMQAWGKLMLLVLVAFFPVVAFSSAGTPQQALLEMALASKPATVEKHLPESLRQALRELGPEDRAAAEQKLLFGHSLCGQGADLVVPDDGQSLLVMQSKESNQTAEIRVKHEIISGGEAMLELGVDLSESSTQSVFVWMRMEDDEWRVTGVDVPNFSQRISLDDPEFVERFRNVQRKDSESRITSTLYSVLYAVRQFAFTYPDVGFPADLSVLAPAGENEEASAEHAGLLQPKMAANEFSSQGYKFRYEVTREGPDGNFTMVARPIESTSTRARSFFLDATGSIHVTDENRDATPDDPLQ